MIGVSRTTHLQWQYLCVYIHYYFTCFACRYNLHNKNISSLNKQKILKVFNYSNSHWLKWLTKKLNPERSSDKMLLNFLYIGSTWVWYLFVLLLVIIISNANMIYARPNTCLGMIWNKISRRSQDIRAKPSCADPYWWTGWTLEVNTHLLCLKDNSRWYDDGT